MKVQKDDFYSFPQKNTLMNGCSHTEGYYFGSPKGKETDIHDICDGLGCDKKYNSLIKTLYNIIIVSFFIFQLTYKI